MPKTLSEMVKTPIKIKAKKNTEINNIPYKPTFYLSSQELPAIKDWQVGKEYELLIKVKQIALRENLDEKGGKKFNADFEIQSIALSK